MLQRERLLMAGVWILGVVLGPALADDHVPSFIYYQGQLRQADGTPVSDGQYSVAFSLYDAETGGTVVWT